MDSWQKFFGGIDQYNRSIQACLSEFGSVPTRVRQNLQNKFLKNRDTTATVKTNLSVRDMGSRIKK